MQDVVIQRVRSEDAAFVGHLASIGFAPIVLEMRSPRFMSKVALILQAAQSPVRLLRKLRAVGELETVVTIGHLAFVVKLLARVHAIRYRRMLCSGFFVRSPSWFPVFRLLCRLDGANDHYLIHSQAEIDLYAWQLKIDRHRMHYIPPGDWHPLGESNCLAGGGYYFSGGYSNRDYLPVIRAFRTIPARLVLICASLNREIENSPVPQNVTILKDVTDEVFESYVQNAKAGIIPLKHDTGASGQTVALRLMRNAKMVVATGIGPMRDFVQHGITGYLVSDMETELPNLIGELEEDPQKAVHMGQAARRRYIEHFSRESLAEAFGVILARLRDAAVLP